MYNRHEEGGYDSPAFVRDCGERKSTCPYLGVHTKHELQVYLTLLFILPIRSKYIRSFLLVQESLTFLIVLELYSYRHSVNGALRAIALRTFVGSCATLTSSVVNITVLMVLEGEPGWICMMCCNADSKS